MEILFKNAQRKIRINSKGIKDNVKQVLENLDCHEKELSILVVSDATGKRHVLVFDGAGQVDLVPTLLDLTGSDIPDQLEGKSLLPVLSGEADLSDNDVFIQWNGMGDRNLGSPEINRMVSMPWRGVVTGDRWKLNLSPGDNCELYDLNTDPAELENFFEQPEHHDRILDMASRIRIWQDETGDDMPLPTL